MSFSDLEGSAKKHLSLCDNFKTISSLKEDCEECAVPNSHQPGSWWQWRDWRLCSPCPLGASGRVGRVPRGWQGRGDTLPEDEKWQLHQSHGRRRECRVRLQPQNIPEGGHAPWAPAEIHHTEATWRPPKVRKMPSLSWFLNLSLFRAI
jgi:hypothetical protein